MNVGHAKQLRIHGTGIAETMLGPRRRTFYALPSSRILLATSVTPSSGRPRRPSSDPSVMLSCRQPTTTGALRKGRTTTPTTVCVWLSSNWKHESIISPHAHDTKIDRQFREKGGGGVWLYGHSERFRGGIPHSRNGIERPGRSASGTISTQSQSSMNP